MAKYAPHLRALAPGATLLSPGYSATEGSIGIAASLLQAVRPLPPSHGPVNGTAVGSSGREAARGAGAAAGGPDEEAFVLLPHIGCFYELLDLESGVTCRCEALPGCR